MPCNCDHMEPTARERHQREAATHLVYIYGRMGQPVPAEIARCAADIYGGQTDEWVKFLCTMFKEMNQEQIDRIVYDAKDKRSRALADWYEEHQEVDRQRDWLDVVEKAQANPNSFTAQHAYAIMLTDGGYNQIDTAAKIAEASGAYYDSEDSTHIFQFDDGIIILSAMDGLVAYKGESV